MAGKERYDVFIAYHGNNETGSERKAREIYSYIQNKEIYKGKKVNAYLHPVTNPYGRFLDTPKIVYATPLFLLVANGNIRRDGDGLICEETEDGDMGYLSEEINAFQNNMYRKYKGKSAQVFAYDGLDIEEAGKLNPVFGAKATLFEMEKIWEWVRGFYCNEYVERFYEDRKRSTEDDKFEIFKEGLWVDEAKMIFEALCNEKIGRCLLLYYIERVKIGDTYAKQCLKDVCDKLRAECEIEEKNTRELMFHAEKYM